MNKFNELISENNTLLKSAYPLDIVNELYKFISNDHWTEKGFISKIDDIDESNSLFLTPIFTNYISLCLMNDAGRTTTGDVEGCLLRNPKNARFN